ncbi:MAG: hypothetical protein ABIL58_07950 [Pseudomonadota bacterium]
MIELPHKRDHFAKHFLLPDGQIRAQIHTTPIHYKNIAGIFDDINLTAEDTSKANSKGNIIDSVLFEKAMLTVGARKDGSLNKMIGVRIHDSQLEFTPVSIKLDGAEQLKENTSKVKNKNNEIEISIGQVKFIQHINRSGMNLYYELLKQVNSFKLVFMINATNIIPLNSFNTYTKEYAQNSDGSFLFMDSAGKDVSIPFPIMKDAQGSVSRAIKHRLYEEDGVLYYEKSSTPASILSLRTAAYPVLLDVSIYTAANRYINNVPWDATTGTWATLESVSAMCSALDYKGNLIIGYNKGAWYTDTSSIGSAATITAASLEMVNGCTVMITYGGYVKIMHNGTSPSCSWPYYTPASDPTGVSYNRSYYISYPASDSISVPAHAPQSYTNLSLPLNSTGLNYINKTGLSRFMIMERDWDIAGVTPTTPTVAGFAYIQNSSPAMYCYMSITYTAGGIAGISKMTGVTFANINKLTGAANTAMAKITGIA